MVEGISSSGEVCLGGADVRVNFAITSLVTRQVLIRKEICNPLFGNDSAPDYCDGVIITILLKMDLAFKKRYKTSIHIIINVQVFVTYQEFPAMQILDHKIFITQQLTIPFSPDKKSRSIQLICPQASQKMTA
jgi:hypothetical protein